MTINDILISVLSYIVFEIYAENIVTLGRCMAIIDHCVLLISEQAPTSHF